MTKLLLLSLFVLFSGCKYYGSALPPEYPVSMDDAIQIANDNASAGPGLNRPVIRQLTRPQINQPSYVPEKELAMVAPPRTLLVWTYPHITPDNRRIFGNWSTVFLRDRYEWLPPANTVPADQLIRRPTPFIPPGQ